MRKLMFLQPLLSLLYVENQRFHFSRLKEVKTYFTLDWVGQ